MAELYTLTVATKRGSSLQLLFHNSGRAEAAWTLVNAAISPPTFLEDRGLSVPEAQPLSVTLADDYGMRATFMAGEVGMAWMSDLGQESEGKTQLALAQARANAKANKAAQQDPDLRQPTITQPGTAASILGARRN
jgi:hypothetical protein